MFKGISPSGHDIVCLEFFKKILKLFFCIFYYFNVLVLKEILEGKKKKNGSLIKNPFGYVVTSTFQAF